MRREQLGLGPEPPAGREPSRPRSLDDGMVNERSFGGKHLRRTQALAWQAPGQCVIKWVWCS